MSLFHSFCPEKMAAVLLLHASEVPTCQNDSMLNEPMKSSWLISNVYKVFGLLIGHIFQQTNHGTFSLQEG